MSACRNRCEQDIKKDLEYNNALKERETKAMNIGGTSYNLFAVMQLLFGLFFSFTALYLIPQDDESDAYNFLRKFLLLVGVIFAASTIPILIIAKRFKNKELAASNEK